jgi:hypothetical protein
MTYPDGDWLADLEPTGDERRALDEVLGEVEWEEVAGLPPGGDDDEPGAEGPWDDQLGQLEAIGETLDETHALDGQRIGEDIVAELDRRPNDEAKLARALRRIESGTYTEPPQLRGDPAAAAAARDPLGRWASACGDLDDFGRCAARYHDPSCHVVTEEAAATGTTAEAEAWNATLNTRTPHLGIDATALGLANEPRPGDGVDLWGDLLEAPAGPSGYEMIRARLMHEMALADAPPRTRDPAAPDVSAIRAALGL